MKKSILHILDNLAADFASYPWRIEGVYQRASVLAAVWLSLDSTDKMTCREKIKEVLPPVIGNLKNFIENCSAISRIDGQDLVKEYIIVSTLRFFEGILAEIHEIPKD